MRKNTSSIKILFLFLLLIFVFSSAEAQEKQTSLKPSEKKLNRLLLAQGARHGHSRSYSLQPPAVSISACTAVTNTDPNSPGNPICVGRGGSGRYGFWRQETWILIHFRGLTPGRHRLYNFYQGRNRQGIDIYLGRKDVKFTNNQTSYFYWFRAPYIVGEHCAPCWAIINLDGERNNIGNLEYSGSFD